MILLFIDLKV